MVVWATVLIVCCVIIEQGSFATASPSILAPKTIQAFSYDVAVHVNDATIGDVVQLFGRNQDEPITAQVIMKSSETSTLIFNCGYFFEIGDYSFKVLRKGKILASSPPVTATKWPKVEITWQKYHEALTTDVKVTLSAKKSMCKSDIARQKDLLLRLRRTSNDTEANTVSNTDNSTRIFSLTKSGDSFLPSYFVIPCEAFKTVGEYQVDLIVTSTSSDVIAATSDVMEVDWSKEYNLKIPKTAFPCKGTGVNVFLSFPPCASENDSVRLISVTNHTGKVIGTQVRGQEDHVTFPCDVFYNVNEAVDGFCFEYVVESGHVTRTVCQPVSKDEGFNIPGSWSPWTSWSTCTRPCLSELERRKRLCNDPRPRGGGALCTDTNGKESLDELQYSDKGVPATCDQRSKLAELVRLFDDKCECGCSLPEAEQGAIVTSLTNDCEKSRTLIWTVKVPDGHIIRFRLNDHQLAKDELLTVRDGITSWPLTSQFPTVSSRSNIVIIQWVKSKTLHNLRSCGFILSYEAVVKPTSKTATPTVKTNSSIGSDGLAGLSGWFENTITDNPVVIGGIAACGLIIVIVVVAVAIHCRRKNKTKIPPGCHTPMNTRLSMPPDGRSCSNEDTESEPMVRPRPIGNAGNCETIDDTCIPVQPSVHAGTAYYLAQRQLELMKRLGKDEHSQTYATGCLTDDNLRQQEELLFGDRKSLHESEKLRVS